jgi:hypothetical protein
MPSMVAVPGRSHASEQAALTRAQRATSTDDDNDDDDDDDAPASPVSASRVAA